MRKMHTTGTADASTKDATRESSQLRLDRRWTKKIKRALRQSRAGEKIPYEEFRKQLDD